MGGGRVVVGSYFEVRIYVFGQCTDMRNVCQYIGRFYNRNVDGSVEKEHLILLMVYQDFHWHSVTLYSAEDVLK